MTKYEYKCVRIKKNGLCKLIMNVCKKNVVLPREWAGIVVGIWSHHSFIINLHSPFFFILTHLYSYFVIHFYPLKTVDQTVESLYFLNIFSQRSSLNF